MHIPVNIKSGVQNFKARNFSSKYKAYRGDWKQEENSEKWWPSMPTEPEV